MGAGPRTWVGCQEDTGGREQPARATAPPHSCHTSMRLSRPLLHCEECGEETWQGSCSLHKHPSNAPSHPCCRSHSRQQLAHLLELVSPPAVSGGCSHTTGFALILFLLCSNATGAPHWFPLLSADCGHEPLAGPIPCPPSPAATHRASSFQ